MRLGYITNGLVHHTLADAIDLVADLGYTALGITLDVTHLDPFRATDAELARVRSHCEARGLAIAIETGARFLLDPRAKHEPTLVSPDPAGRARRLDYYARAVDVACALGAGVVSMWSGVLRPGVEEARAWGWLVDGIGATCALAAARGVRVAFEPEPGMLVATLAQFGELVRRVGRPDLGLTIDLGHLECVEDRPLSQPLAPWRERLVHVHVDDIAGRAHHHLPIGEGEIDFEPLFRELGRIGYAGMALVELSRDAHRAPEVARAAFARLSPLVAAATSAADRGGR